VDEFLDESVQLALFWHGLLEHSSISTSQFPLEEPPLLSITVHCFAYCWMNPALHAPLAKPAAHVQRYALIEIPVSMLESVHLAPFLHGELAHSLTSTLQLPE
jgi:hypothetical protein